MSRWFPTRFDSKVLSFSPGFSPVREQRHYRATISTVSGISLGKPLKRLLNQLLPYTRLKPGENERRHLRRSLSDTINIEIGGVQCLCLGLERLIEVKRAAGRPKDLETIAELEQIMRERDA